MDRGAPDPLGARHAPFRTRIEALFSGDGNTAVLLRRGPRRHYHLVKWDLRCDTFARGQWMKGTVHLCDLDHRGDTLLYWARQWHRSAPRHDDDDDVVERVVERYDPLQSPPRLGKAGRRRIPRYLREENARALQRRPLRPRRNEGVWTAVSRPPYFSALAIWPCHGHWTGGGWFEDDRTICLQEDERGLVPKVNVQLPPDLTIKRASWSGANRSAARRVGLAERPDDGAGRQGRFDDLTLALAQRGVRWVEWFRPHGADLLLAADGKLFRLERYRTVAPADALDMARPLLDLRPMRFELVGAPPSALQWARRARAPARKVPPRRDV